LNPLKTLTGRLVLVTLIAVAISYAIAFFLYANERGAALRRAAENAAIERIVFTAERLGQARPAMRPALAEQVRDHAIRYRVDTHPATQNGAASGPARRIARGVSAALGGAETHASARLVEGRVRRWRDDAHQRGAPIRIRAGEPRARVTEVSLSVRLDEASWLNARARLPGPRPAPAGVIIGGLASLLLVGIGAALVARQIGRPLAQLADAAEALGAGQTNVSAPVSGPADVQRASSAFNAMAERLGRQLNRQRQMLWALSHDLRTPITALRLRTELVDDEPLRLRLLASIEEMERMTEQALALARAGASEEARTTVDLAEIVRTLCGELEDMGLAIRADAPAPVMARIRPGEIARALRNLAENAVKYAGAGVMRVTRSETGEIVAEVADEGPGVPPDLLPRLTEPFFRADAARGDAKGAGLGLAIAQAIADGHGGRLVLENRSPRGFSAKLVLPA
jgi:signal transduction histidine kinase